MKTKQNSNHIKDACDTKKDKQKVLLYEEAKVRCSAGELCRDHFLTFGQR